MAVTAVNAFANFDDATTTIFTTASYAFQNNQLYTLAVQGDRTANPTISSVTGGGITWVEVTNEPFDTIATPTFRTTVLRGLVTSGAATGALTITTSGTAGGLVWSCDEWSGMDTTGTNGSGAIGNTAVNATDSATALTATLASVTSGNASYGAFATSVGTGSAIVVGTGYTSLGSAISGSELRSLLTEYKSTGDTTPNVTFASAAAGGVAIEIKAAGAAGINVALVKLTLTESIEGTITYATGIDRYQPKGQIGGDGV